MIVVDEGSRLLLFTQTDHAFFAAQLLSLWRTTELIQHPRRQEIIFATREHDNGWREADAAPRVNAETGRPHDFLTLPAEPRIELWRRGIARHLDRPVAAALIARHALEIHGERAGDPVWDDFLREVGDRYTEILDQAAIEATTLDSDYHFLDLADRLSLAACNRWTAPGKSHGVRFRLQERSLLLDPFPLAGTTTFRIPCRRIPARRYRGDADLGTELANARWSEWTLSVGPPP